MTMRTFQVRGKAQLVRPTGETIPVAYVLWISREVVRTIPGQPSVPGMVDISGAVDFEGEPPFEAFGESLELRYEDGGSSTVFIKELGQRSIISFSDAGILKSRYFNE